jgi:hypothetical protein
MVFYSLFLIEVLISSKTHIKFLLKFFLNPTNRAYLRGHKEEFGESPSDIKLELNKMKGTGMIFAQIKGNKKIFTANIGYPLFKKLHGVLIKYVCIEQIIENVDLEIIEKVKVACLAKCLEKRNIMRAL